MYKQMIPALKSQNVITSPIAWIPAFAGMTETTHPSFRASDARPGIREFSVFVFTLSTPPLRESQ